MGRWLAAPPNAHQATPLIKSSNDLRGSLLRFLPAAVEMDPSHLGGRSENGSGGRERQGFIEPIGDSQHIGKPDGFVHTTGWLHGIASDDLGDT
jgi:hypothetical protein